LSGIPSGIIKPGDPPTEVEVTLYNNSPVDYPKVGVVFVLTHCSCAIYPSGLPQGTADRFDPATGRWIPLGHPVITTGPSCGGSCPPASMPGSCSHSAGTGARCKYSNVTAPMPCVGTVVAGLVLDISVVCAQAA
jgi:hypothetical protein